ncbi:alkene reductase [Pseudomonas sp. L13]|nr:alkene reductase [Pseudomonas sp. L13]
MTSSIDTLFEPIVVGDIALSNRIVMAPMTRARCNPEGVPTPLMREYYTQRSSAGLIIAEASQISLEGRGYVNTPGIHTQQQVQGWKSITQAVHDRGGKIALQLWHVGRISHVSLQEGGKAPVAPSAIQANTRTFTAQGFEAVSAPRALESREVLRVIHDYRDAALCAMDAGFDGVEIHGANGYLIDQFLRDGSNQRSDEWGGDLQRRTRFLYEVAQAVASVVGKGRTGVRLSLADPVSDASDSDPQRLMEHAIQRLDSLGLAYVHVIEGDIGAPRPDGFDYAKLRSLFSGAWLANNAYTAEGAAQSIASGRSDFVSFGRPFIANPDLVARIRHGYPLTDVRMDLIYGGEGAEGYTDYREYVLK